MQVNVFCGDLQSIQPAATHSIQINAQTATLSSSAAVLQFNATLRMSHPVVSLPSSAVAVDLPTAVISSVGIDQTVGALCSAFVVSGNATYDPWSSLETSICITVSGAGVTDVYGGVFPDARSCSTFRHPPFGKLLLPFVLQSTDGAVTSDSTTLLVAAFSEPVMGLAADSFAAAPEGASILSIKTLQSAQTYYEVGVGTAADYVGPVNISLSKSCTNSLNVPNQVIPQISYSVVSQPLLQSTAFRVLAPPVTSS